MTLEKKVLRAPACPSNYPIYPKSYDLDKGISGGDVVTESLRRICIWKEYGKDGVGLPWWDYVDEFLYRCDAEDFFTNEDCIKDAMKHANIE